MTFKKHHIIIGLALIAAIGFCGTAMAQAPITVTGTLMDDFAIAADDGEVYDVAESEVAYEMFEMAGSRVSVTGTMVDTEDGPMFKVQSYKLLDE
jgi:hypothetical protein